MYLEESPYQRDQLINIDQLIGRALDHGVNLGENHHQTIENYVNSGLLPRLLNGQFPATALDRLISIDELLKKGTSLEEIQKLLKEERRKFLKKPMDLSTLVDAYKGASKSLLMLGSIGLLIFFGSYFVVNLPESGIKSSVTKPVGRVLAQFIKEAKPANSTSTDPLGLTNVSKVITINEKQEVIIQKTITASDTSTPSTTNQLLSNESIKVDNLEVKNILSQEITFPNLSGAGSACVLALDIAQVLSCNKDLLWTSDTIKNIADTSVASGFSNLAISGTGINVSRTANNFALSLANEALSSIDGVKNNAGDIDFVAGAGVTITPNDTNNTITFNLAGSGVNADLLDSIDSTSFLRSDTSDNFTSGTLTLDAGTTLSVLGSFSCSDCVGDTAIPNVITVGAGSSVNAGTINSGTLGNASVTLAFASFGSITGSLADGNVVDTITASNYLALAGGTMAGNIDFNNNLPINLGAAGTDFTSGGGLNVATDLDVNGHVAFGGSGAVQTWALIHIDETISVAAARGIYLIPTFSTSAFTVVNSFHNEPNVNPTSALATARVQYNRLVVGGSSSITFATGIQIDSASISGSTVSNLYGLYISNQTGATNNYGIYVADAGTNAIFVDSGASRFDGLVSVGLGGTASTTAVCSSLANATAPTGGVAYELRDCSGAPAADYMEMYSVESDIETGDIVVTSNSYVITKDGDRLAKLTKSSSAYQGNLIGVVSNSADAGDFNSIGYNINSVDNPKPIALNGRVKVKVSTENGPIFPGDYLTSSSTPGTAMKATQSGPVIGKALEGFNQTGVGKVLVFVTNSYYSKPLATGSNNSAFNLQEGQLTLDSIILGENQIKLGTKGNIEITGEIALEGSLRISKTLYAANIETNQLKVSNLNIDQSSGSVGTTTLLAGQAKVVVKSTLVTSGSRIFTTALNFTSGQPLIITNKTAGDSFVVEIEHSLDHDIKFDWWIVN